MVSAAICLTALIGCLSVSAANGEAPVYTVATVEGKKGETVDVNVTGADLTEICGQDLSIIFAAGLTIGTVHDNITNDDLVCDPDGDGMQYNVIVNDDGTNTLKMVDIINFPEYTGSPELVTGTFDVTISVTIPADAAAGTEYPITIDESQFADYDEAWVEPTLTNGKITVVADAPVCTHENLEFVSAVPATADAAGSITFKCKDCNEDVVKTVNYYQYYTTSRIAPAYESEVLLNFGIRNDWLSQQGEPTNGFVILTKSEFNSESITNIYSLSEADTDVLAGCKSWKVGLPAKMLNDTISSIVYVECNGEWYNGAQISSSFMEYAASIFDTVSETEKTLIADLANYGAAAQIHFNYDIDNLASSKLSSAQIAYATEGTAEYANDFSNPYDLDSETIFVSGVALSAESRLTINYFFTTRFFSGNIDDLSAQVTYTDAHGELKTATYNSDSFYYSSENTYGLDFAELAAYDLRKPVTISFYENDVKVSCDVVYSAQSMAYNANTSGYAQTEINLYNEMLQYCDSANAHFIK